jgi:hypothetical protein
MAANTTIELAAAMRVPGRVTLRLSAVGGLPLRL